MKKHMIKIIIVIMGIIWLFFNNITEKIFWKEISKEEILYNTNNLDFNNEIIKNIYKYDVKIYKKNKISNILWHYNPNNNEIILNLSEYEYNLKNKELLKNNLIKEVLKHEFLHYILRKDEKLEKKIIKELKKILKNEEWIEIKELFNNNKISKLKIMANRLSKENSFLISKERIKQIYYQEIICYYYMNIENKDNYKEISSLLFK